MKHRVNQPLIPPPPRGVDTNTYLLDSLNLFCKSRFNATIRTTSRQVRPILFYCLAEIGIEKKWLYTRLGVARSYFYRDVKDGEFMATKTPSGRRLYVEIQSFLVQNLAERLKNRPIL